MCANPTSFTTHFNALFFCGITIFEKVNQIGKYGKELRQARKNLGPKRLQPKKFKVGCAKQGLEGHETAIAAQKRRQTSIFATTL